MWTKFGLPIDFDLLKAMTSTNMKPEVVFSDSDRHFWEMDMTSYCHNPCSDFDKIR